MQQLLLTAFEPFGGEDINASAELLARLANDLPDSLATHIHLLPVDAQLAAAQIRTLLHTLRPEWFLLLGQANGRAALTVERVAVNLCDFRLPDNGGNQPIDQPVVLDGPDAYFATLPVKQMVQAASDAGALTEPSLTAGAYVCNLSAYTALHTCALEGLATRCGFVHVPLLPVQTIPGDGVPSMELATMQRGVRAMIQVLADHSPHDQQSAMVAAD